MLPFLKRNHEGSASSPVESIKREHDEDYDLDPIESVAEELCHAVEKKDYRLIAEALRAAFQIFESEPHEEGEHV